MEYTQSSQSDSLVFFILVVSLLFIFTAIYYFIVVVPFTKTKRRIKIEIARSDGEEYYFWKTELKKLYINQIPLLGKLIVKFIK